MSIDPDTGTESRTLDALMCEVDLVALDARAVRTSVDLVDRVTAADLTRPTPCADWTLHGLLTHMIAQHHGFAAAVRGDSDPTVWKTRALGGDPVASYRAAATEVGTAFAEPDVLDRKILLAEFSGEFQFSGAQAVSFHFIDYVVHSWDVARTLDLPVHFDADLLDAAHVVAAAVPGGATRLAPGAAFGPEVPWSTGDRLDQIVAMLGRSPRWPDD